MDHHGEISSWFTHPVYSRYWQHYQQALAWQQRHKQAYRRALEAFASPPFLGPGTASHAHYPDWHLAEGADTEGEGSGLVMTSDPLLSTDWCAPKSCTDQVDTDSDSEIECDVSNMVITDELRQYFAQTERHREELKKQQQMEAEQENAYVLADQDLHRVSWCSSLPPAERPGERRGAEMKKLYGENAAKIMGMETAMQLNFDRNCDRKQPRYWPVIPLKL
ncbi:gem-associated protein 8 [Megalops cyprinoides]|uniref:gem-associated protein 8 n=1 Tax=Megalops cyprinoides TaxID=118141 RepID=UPI001864675D|nr:gem-associated protein 8 [Megalops cyprinoides]